MGSMENQGEQEVVYLTDYSAAGKPRLLWTDIGLMRSILTFLIGFHCPRSVVDLGWQTGDLIDRFPSTVEAARSFLGGADPLLKSLGPILSPAALPTPPPSPAFRPPARG